ncbi:MAG: hypothetical protein V5A43_08175 [Haloarculaceae archaeon]
MDALPLQLVDSFLLNYNVGDALLVLFGVGILATLPLRSAKVLTLHLILFGVIFFMTPGSLFAVEPSGSHLLGSNLQYKMLGFLLLTLGPIVYATR